MSANYLFIRTIHDHRLADTERVLNGPPSAGAMVVLTIAPLVARAGRRVFVRLLRGSASVLAAVATWLDASTSDADLDGTRPQRSGTA